MTIFKIPAARSSFFYHIWVILCFTRQGKSPRRSWKEARQGGRVGGRGRQLSSQ